VAYLEEMIAGQPSDHLAGAKPPTAGDLAAFVHTGGTTGAPKVGDTTLTVIPFTWNSGSTSRLRVSGVISNQPTMISAVALTLAWSSMTPLGRPVVPLV